MTALPPLPSPKIAYGYAWKVPIAKHDYYTAEQVEAIRRADVEACAQVCVAQARHWDTNRPVPLYGFSAELDLAAAKIRALLEKQP
jgi:hypothetical protein